MEGEVKKKISNKINEKMGRERFWTGVKRNREMRKSKSLGGRGYNMKNDSRTICRGTSEGKRVGGKRWDVTDAQTGSGADTVILVAKMWVKGAEELVAVRHNGEIEKEEETSH